MESNPDNNNNLNANVQDDPNGDNSNVLSLIKEEYPLIRKEVPENAINILTYWFGIEYWKRIKNPNSESYQLERQHYNNNLSAYWDDMWVEKWFAKEELTRKVDDHIRSNWGTDIEKAVAGELTESWTTTHHGTLALIVLLVSDLPLPNTRICFKHDPYINNLFVIITCYSIVQDQFTRNIYRGTAKSWSGDSLALSISLRAIANGQDKLLKPVPR